MFNHQSGEFLYLEDTRIYYETTGASKGHPVVLLHGGLGSLEDFSPVIDLIPDPFYVVAVDMRGHGRSQLGTRPLTYQQHQADIQSLIEHLGLKEYSLIGFSDGGVVAYRIASESQAVKALITIGSQWRLSPQEPSFNILAGVTPSPSGLISVRQATHKTRLHVLSVRPLFLGAMETFFFHCLKRQKPRK